MLRVGQRHRLPRKLWPLPQSILYGTKRIRYTIGQGAPTPLRRRSGRRACIVEQTALGFRLETVLYSTR